MTFDEIRANWSALRHDANAEGFATKDSQGVLFRLFETYRCLSEEERVVVNRLIADQVLSPDEVDRFDAVALIQEFAITSALPALRTLAIRLEGDSLPGAPFEWAKVNRVIGNLRSSAS